VNCLAPAAYVTVTALGSRSQYQDITAMFESIDDVLGRFQAQHYVCGRQIATVVYLAARLRKPLLVEGPAGVGKTELAKVLAASLSYDLIRLQCYEGLDEAKALY
jgi:MoxR-like ATPase